MDDYAKATAAGTPVTIQGKSYRAAKFGPKAIGDLNAWLKAQKPDPRLMAKDLLPGLSDAVAREIWRDLWDESKDWPLMLGHPEGAQLLATTSEGSAQVVWVSLRKYQPGIDLAAARAIADEMDPEEVGALIAAGFPEDSFDPKAGTSSSLPAAETG